MKLRSPSEGPGRGKEEACRSTGIAAFGLVESFSCRSGQQDNHPLLCPSPPKWWRPAAGMGGGRSGAWVSHFVLTLALCVGFQVFTKMGKNKGKKVEEVRRPKCSTSMAPVRLGLKRCLTSCVEGRREW